MLTHLLIRDFAVVEQLELDVHGGMTVLTGETGAGKSILVDALGLALGDRADSGVVRHGARRADIIATFDVSAIPEATTWLSAHDLDQNSDCVLRRVIQGEGRSRAYVNGTPTPVQQVRELAERLIEIHGQHEHQTLPRRERQRGLLDDFATHGDRLTAVRTTYADWHGLRTRLDELGSARRDRDDRVDLLRFQVGEFQTLALVPAEATELEEEHDRLAHAGRLLEGSRLALDVLYEDDEQSAHRLVNRAVTELQTLADIDTRLGPAVDMLSGAAIQIQEAADDLRRYASQLELDPARLDWVDARLGAIHALARKHQLSPAELPAFEARLSDELADLENADLRLEQLQSELSEAERRYRAAAVALTASRVTAAETLSKAVTESIQGLGMPGGEFRVEIGSDPAAPPTAHGLDTVEFRVSANPGQPPKPLAQVASGGELSRISLAIQVITANSAGVPTLIFDEVDSGIGGGTAEVVGRLLRQLGLADQVLCVTHLPQVAAQAHNHLQVNKTTRGANTKTSIQTLAGDGRVHEVARMLGGVKLTAQTLNHAREMIDLAGTS